MSNKKVSLFVRVKKGTTVKKKNKKIPTLTKKHISTSSSDPVLDDPVPEPSKFNKKVTNSGLTILSRDPIVQMPKNTKNKEDRKKSRHEALLKRQNSVIRKKTIRQERHKLAATRKESIPAGITIVESTHNDNSDDDSHNDSDDEMKLDENISQDDMDKDFKRLINSVDTEISNNDAEELIDKLETYKYKQKRTLKKFKKKGADTAKIKKQMTIISKVLARVKKTQSELRIAKDKRGRKKIITQFKNKFKKLKKKDFIRKIDLTAPKKDRAPEPGVALWQKSKKVTYADNGYRHKKASEEKKIMRRIERKKSMDSDMLKQIQRKTDANFNKVNVMMNHRKLMGYQKYNPFNYQRAIW